MRKEDGIIIKVRQSKPAYVERTLSETSATEIKSIPLIKGMSLYNALQKAGIFLDASCAGNGTCGACKVRVLQGNLRETQKDKVFLEKWELEAGWRLACQAYPTETCEIDVPVGDFMVVTAYERGEKIKESPPCNQPCNKEGEKEPLGIAIDLGTTTLVYELFSLTTGKTIDTFSTVNPQKIFGADVLCRIEQSNTGKKAMLKNILRQGMKKDIKELLGETGPERIHKIAVSGNTVMVHLFMGYSCEGLGKYPFTPETLEQIETDAVSVGLMDLHVPVIICPGISSYVGGDALMGMASCQETEHRCRLFVDLGTNAEVILEDDRGDFFVTSAPAGPAFEAANISCGVGSVEGAICSVEISPLQKCGYSNEKEKIMWKTIGQSDPIGFCGSGILEAVYELLENEIVDETGLLKDEYFECGYPIGHLRITQKDIRQIQLGKAAVATAIEILLERANLSPKEVKNVYLAGGFGYHLNTQKAMGIGLLPKEFAGKIKVLGNASLKGAKEFLLGQVEEETWKRIKTHAREIYLSKEEMFQERFLANLGFENCHTSATVLN